MAWHSFTCPWSLVSYEAIIAVGSSSRLGGVYATIQVISSVTDDLRLLEWTGLLMHDYVFVLVAVR